MANVRPRTEADLEPLEEVLRSCHARFGWPLEGLPDAKAFICDDHAPLEQAWVAEYEGQIVGHIAITKAVDDNPAVAMWRKQGGTDHVAVVGRLFVHPGKTGKASGVTRALVNACDAWARETNAWLVMYCVVWSPARQLMCQILTARFGWLKMGNAVYHSTDGRDVDAVCYAAPRQGIALAEPENPRGQGAMIIERVKMMSSLGLWSLWNNVSSKSNALSGTSVNH